MLEGRKEGRKGGGEGGGRELVHLKLITNIPLHRTSHCLPSASREKSKLPSKSFKASTKPQFLSIINPIYPWAPANPSCLRFFIFGAHPLESKLCEQSGSCPQQRFHERLLTEWGTFHSHAPPPPRPGPALPVSSVWQWQGSDPGTPHRPSYFIDEGSWSSDIKPFVPGPTARGAECINPGFSYQAHSPVPLPRITTSVQSLPMSRGPFKHHILQEAFHDYLIPGQHKSFLL